MTTKHLSGAYPGGYTLSAAYTGLDIQAGASVGGTGVTATFFATIQNDGVINATTVGHYGITLDAGGVVTNGSATDVTALIKGDSGIYCRNGQSLILANFGTISGNAGYGVVFYGGSSITNGSATDTTALIEGSKYQGVWAAGPSSNTITNFGTIESVSSDGVFLIAGGIETNGSATDTTALIEGYIGIRDYGSDTITNFGTIKGTGGVAVYCRFPCDVQVEAGCVFQGAVVGGGGRLDLAPGVGTISGLSGGNVTVSGSMAATTFSGFGTLEIAGGAIFTLTGASTLGSNGTKTLVDAGTLVVAGPVAGTGRLVLHGGKLTLLAGTSFSAATASFTAGSVVNGAGTLTLTNATLAGLTVGGRAVLNDVGTFDQTDTIDLRHHAKTARLTIAQGAIYGLDGDVGFARRDSSTPMIAVGGLFIKAAGTGVSAVGVRVADLGTIEAATGTLSFLVGASGTGLMKIDAGARLQLAKTVASTLTASFAGAGGTLALSDGSLFAATIAGFAAGETIDLVNTAATSALLNGSNQLVITNGATAVATLQLSGTYTGASFTTASDGHGGTAITVSTGPSHAFIAAMAALTSDTGAAHIPAWGPRDGARPLLANPRTALG